MNHTIGLTAWCGFSFIIPRELSWARYRGCPAGTKKDIYIAFDSHRYRNPWGDR